MFLERHESNDVSHVHVDGPSDHVHDEDHMIDDAREEEDGHPDPQRPTSRKDHKIGMMCCPSYVSLLFVCPGRSES